MPRDETPRTVLKSVAGWQLGQTLGKGGFGHVRKATHPCGRQAAVKILPALRHDTQMSKDMMLDALEAHKEVVLLKMLGGLGVRGIIGLDMVREDGKWKYLFLPMMPKTGTEISIPAKPHIFIPQIRGLLSSLHVLHQLGFSHEDLKPANCLVDAKDRLILADFGFATFSPQGKKQAASGGTLHYSSPEKVANKRYLGPPSDVWAVGVLMCKWLANYNPFLRRDDEDDEIIEDRIMTGRARHVIPDEGPDSVGHLIRGMLLVDAQARWTIPEVLEHPYLNPRAGPSAQEPLAFPLESPIHPKLCFDAVLEPDLAILEEVVFLASVANEWWPVMSDAKIRERLARPAQESRCWEKSAYHALSAWREKDPDQSGSVGPKGLMVKPKMKPLIKVFGEVDLNSPRNKLKQQQSHKINEYFKAVKAASPAKPASKPVQVLPDSDWSEGEDPDDSIQEITRAQAEAATAKIKAAKREVFVGIQVPAPAKAKAAPLTRSRRKEALAPAVPSTEKAAAPQPPAVVKGKKLELDVASPPRKAPATRKTAPKVAKQSKTAAEGYTLLRKPAGPAKKGVKALEEEEFLPEPLPHVRRRSPRLMGLQPETEGLSYGPKRRVSPLVS